MKKKFISIFTIICMLAVYMPSLAFANDGTIPDEQVTEEVTEPEEVVEEEVTEPEEEPVVEEEKAEPEEGIELSGGQKSDNNIVLNNSDTSGDTIYDYDATATHRDKEGTAVADTDNYKAYTSRSKETYEKIQTGQTFTSKKVKGYKCVDVKCSVNHGDRTTFDVKHVGDTWAVFVEPRLGDFERVEDGNTRELDVHIQFIYEKTSKVTLNCVDTKGKAIADPTSIEVLPNDEVEIVAPDHKITGYAPTGTFKENGLTAKRVGENRYAIQVEEGVDGSLTIEYDKTKTEQLYLRVIVKDGVDDNPTEQGTYLIYEGEKNNGASLSTKYANKEEAIETGLYDRLSNKYAETDVHCKVENGVVKFNWIHHKDSNGHNPERMSSDYQLTVDGKKIKSSDVDIDYQESGTDQFDIHIFTATIDLSKLTDVVVHYVDEEGNEIAKSETLTNYEDEKFDPETIEIKKIEGYENPEVGEVPEKYPPEGETEDVYVVYEKVPEYVVTYTDGVAGEEVFKDQVYPELKKGVDTPAFEGKPEREGYVFSGWSPEVLKTVEGNITYIAQWKPGKVPYAVEYYYQKNGEYGEPENVINHLGDTGTEATLTSKDIIPDKDGYVLDEDNENTIKAAEIKADGSTVLRVYFEEQFDVIIHYVDKETGYEVEDARYENAVKWGEEIDALSPVPPTGYKLENSDDERIQRTIKEDFEYTVYYVPIEYNVVIHYVDEVGNELAKDYVDVVRYGKSFEKASPEVEGYEFVNSADSTVGREDVRDNFEYTVVYKLKEFKMVIHYVADEDDTPLRDDYVDEYVYENTKETVYNTDTFEGRELVNQDDEVITYTKTDNHEFTIRYKLVDVDAVIHYVDVDTEEEIAETYKETFKYGQTLEEASPTLEGYELVNASDEVVTNEMKGNYEYTVYYKLKEYPATITYVDEDGNELSDPYTETVKHGDNLEVTSPEIEGYELVNEDDVTVSVENVTEPFTYEVKYTKKEYPVIIHYVDENGKVVAEDVTLNVKYKEAFTTESPTLEGYELVNESDSVVARESVTEPFEYTVVYKMVTPEDPEDPTTPEDPTDPEDVTDNVVIHSTSPQTGDGFELVLWSGAALLAVLLIYYLVAKRKY